MDNREEACATCRFRQLSEGRKKKEKDEFQQTLNQTLIGHGNLEGTIKKNKKIKKNKTINDKKSQ